MSNVLTPRLRRSPAPDDNLLMPARSGTRETRAEQRPALVHSSGGRAAALDAHRVDVLPDHDPIQVYLRT
jgi:hypothetical protein